MIEQDIVTLAQASSAVASIAQHGGGFFAQLPSNQPLPSWTYNTVSNVPELTLAGPNGFIERRLQIDCIGNTAADAINLANALDVVLSGFRGVLATSNVQGVFPINVLDFFDDATRVFRRVLEYTIWYSE